MTRYENTLDGASVKNDQLIKDGKVLLCVGDEFTDKRNPYRSYRCVSMDLHFLAFEKIAVGSFEAAELGKIQGFSTVHFIENELHLVKK